MNYRGILGAAALALILSGQSVQAQSSRVPAEFPPTSFSGNQFVDSEGCAFIRAEVGGIVTWVPRVDRRRNQLCSFQSTFAQVASAPMVAEPVSDVDAPIETVASIATAPSLVQIPTASTATARSPQIVRNAPVLAAAPVVAAILQAAPAPKLTLAELCVDKTGLQQGFISSTTGETIDCGGAAPVPAAAAPLRMTIAQICANMRETGRNFVNVKTGAAVQCGPQTQLLAASAPMGTATENCPATMLFGAGQDVRCGPQTQSITTRTTTFDASAQVTRSTVSVSKAPQSIPASNPLDAAQREVLSVPEGYTRVWSDGRHNPNRSLPQTTADVAPTFEARLSTRTAPVATTHRYVQVGVFANVDNAQVLGARFMGMDLPVGLANSSRGKVVVLGPFASANALNRGLTAARGAGFSDAYTRN